MSTQERGTSTQKSGKSKWRAHRRRGAALGQRVGALLREGLEVLVLRPRRRHDRPAAECVVCHCTLGKAGI